MLTALHLMTPCQRKRILHLNIFQSTIKLNFYANCLKSELFALFLAKALYCKPCYIALVINAFIVLLIPAMLL